MNKPTTETGFDISSGSAGMKLTQGIAAVFVRTDEFDNIVCSAVPAVLDKWAGRSIIKRLMIKPIAKHIRKSFSRERAGGAGTPMIDLFGRAGLTETIAADLPGLAADIVGCAAALCRNIGCLTPAGKTAFLEKIIDNTSVAEIGEIITSLAKTVGDIHGQNRLFLAEKLRPLVRDLIVNADFGEIKDAFDSSADDIIEIAGMLNEELWKYPAKLICLFSLVPGAANIIIGAILKTVKPLNGMAPDLLTDVLLSLIDEIKIDKIGALVNEIGELVRKVHTGSALLGEKGRPLLPQKVFKIASDIMKDADTDLLLRAGEKYSQIKEMCRASITDVIAERPELVKSRMQGIFKRMISSIRIAGRNLSAVEAALTEDEIRQVLSAGLGSIDIQELSDVINRVCAIFNRLLNADQNMIRKLITQLPGGLDEDEFGKAAGKIIEDIAEALRSVAPQIMPPIIRGFAGLVGEAMSVPDSGMRDAVKELRNALFAEGSE